MSEHAWAEVIGVIGLFVLIISVVLSLVWQFAITARAKARLAREDEYKKLAEASAAAQQGIERELRDLREQMARVEARGESIEETLKVVE